MNLPLISLTTSHQRERTGKENRVQVFLARVLLWTYSPCDYLVLKIRFSMNSNDIEPEQVVHTHWTSHRSSWPRGFDLIPVLTPEYLLPSQWIPVLPPIYSLPLRSDCTKVWNRIYPTRDAPFLGSGRRNFAPSRKWRQNHRSYVRTEVLTSMIFVRAQKQSRIVWT